MSRTLVLPPSRKPAASMVFQILGRVPKTWKAGRPEPARQLESCLQGQQLGHS